MPIKHDRSDLPTSGPRPDGFPPDEVPRYGMILANAWAAATIEEDERPHAIEGTRFRLSWAGKCARDLGYWLKGLKPSNPLDIADHWRFGLGTMVHDALQEHFTAAFPGALIEHKVDMRDLDDGIDGSGHIDIWIAKGEHASTVIEVKTINGFGFKKAIGARGPAEGPRANALRQAALEAAAVQADELVILYLSLESLSPREFNQINGVHDSQKFLAEWTYRPSQYLPIAAREAKRVNAVITLLDQGDLPPRSIPDLPSPKARVVDPERGTWQLADENGQIIDAGTTWMCGYCSNRDRCIADGPS